MKLVFLCKRRPMGRDLLERPYGRFFHLPRVLASRGHEVHLALLSYRHDAVFDLQRDSMHWLGDSVSAYGGLRYAAKVNRLVERIRPDWIVGFSDTYYGILAERIGRKHGVRSLIDAYDNYEGYVPWCAPLHRVWRSALRRATAISAAGPALARYMAGSRAEQPTLVAPMAPDPVGFAPLPMADCRTKLALPLEPRLIGYCGAIAPSRGLDVLFDAMDLLRKKVADVQLVLSGRMHDRVDLPAGTTWLGYLPDESMPLLLNSMDVLTTINQASAFGNYSHPIKLYEAMACGVPVVATRTPATEWILGSHPELLSAPADAGDLAERLAIALRRGAVDYGPTPTWEAVGLELECFLARVGGGDR